MKNKVFVFIVAIFLLMSFIVRAEVSHPAEQVKAGTFGSGDYKFPNKLGIGVTPLSDLHVNGQLKIESGIADKIVFDGGQSDSNTIHLANSKGLRFWDTTNHEIFKVTPTGDVSWKGTLTAGEVPWERVTGKPPEAADNLQSVTNRGSSTTNSMTIGGLIDEGNAIIQGNVGIGTGTPIALFHVLTTGAIDATKQFYIERVADDTNGAGVVGRKARGTPTAKLTVKDKDVISGFLGQAYSASAGDYIWAGGIRLEVDGEPDTGGDPTDIPSRLVFYTVPDGSSSLLPRITIKNNGNVGIGTTEPKGKLTITAPKTSEKVIAFQYIGSDFGDVSGLSQAQIKRLLMEMQVIGCKCDKDVTTRDCTPAGGFVPGANPCINCDVKEFGRILLDGGCFDSYVGEGQRLLLDKWYLFDVEVPSVALHIDEGNVGIGTKEPNAKLEVAGGAIKATDGLIIEVRGTGKKCNPDSPSTGQMWLAASGCST